MDEVLAELEDSVADLKAGLSVLRSLGVQIDSIQVAQAKSGLPGAHVFSDELCYLLKSVRGLDALGDEEVEKVGVVDILGTLEGEDFRFGMSVKVVELVLQQVDLVLT